LIAGDGNSFTGGIVTFAKLSESMKTYEFGLRTFLITFSIIIVAEYRQGDPVSVAINRFLVILLGAVIGIGINIFVLPSWAGEELHDFISDNFKTLADSLECMFKYQSFWFPRNFYFYKFQNSSKIKVDSYYETSYSVKNGNRPRASIDIS
jgi:hypothetical protein